MPICAKNFVKSSKTNLLIGHTAAVKRPMFCFSQNECTR